DYVNVSLVIVDEKPIAYSIDFINKESSQGSQKAHIPEYNRYSPGRLLIMGLCDRAREDGESFFDFGRGVDDFKKSFITRSENIYGVFISDNNFFRYYLKIIFSVRNRTYDLLVKFRTLYK